MPATVETLILACANLSPSDRAFADSLLKAWKRYGHLTSKQAYWADKLVARANDSSAPQARATAPVGDMSGVLRLFARAKASRLKHPAIVINLADTLVRLAIATERAQVPGSINV